MTGGFAPLQMCQDGIYQALKTATLIFPMQKTAMVMETGKANIDFAEVLIF